MTVTHKTIRDAGTLRALAHPLRMAMLESLGAEGEATASVLAQRLGDSPSNCSWHLRVLAEHGIVVEAEGGAGRRRPWRLAAHSWELVDDEGAGEAVESLNFDRYARRTRAALAHRRHDDRVWRDATLDTSSLAWLTAPELAALRDDVGAVLRKHWEAHAHRLERPEDRPADARLVQVWATALPVRLEDAT